jgi:hydroxyacylglutathione hydrolase
MILRPFLHDETSCASYLFGCLSLSQLAVVDPRANLVDSYLELATAIGAPIVAVFETHVQADHVSGLPTLVERSGAGAYLPAAFADALREDAPPRPAEQRAIVAQNLRGTSVSHR